MTDNFEELKSCPFCGGTPVELQIGPSRFVRCDGCGACSPSLEGYGAKEAVRQAWNRRAERDCIKGDTNDQCT